MSKATILIVEDEEIVAADLSSKLSRLGYEISGATGRGEEAVVLARDRRPDLVLMDIHLAGTMDGVEAAEIIRREHGLPVIYLTAHSDRATLQRAKLTEPFGYILKPFEEVDLETHLEMALYKHQAERKLRENEARLASLINAAMDAIIVVDAEQRIVLFNPAAERLFGCKFSDVCGGSLDRFIPPRFCEAHRHHVAGFAQSGATNRRMGALGVLSALRATGEEFPIEASISHAMIGNQQLFTVILRDLTERKRAEDQIRQLNAELEQRVLQRTVQLRELTVKLTRAEEQERRRVAHVLHEGLQQTLTGALYCLHSVLGQIKRPAIQEELKAVMNRLNETIEISNSLTYELSPPILNQENLADILLWLGQWFNEKYGLNVEVEIDQAVEVRVEEIRITIFRSVLELLFNVVKHARVKTARISLGLSQKGIARIVVRDEGIGFDAASMRVQAGTNTGFGLFHVRGRAELFGGRLDIESALGGGSRISLLMPLTPAATPPVTSAPSPSPYRRPRASKK